MTIEPPLPMPNTYMPLIFLVTALMFSACGPTREETWNSYYYGTSRQSDAYYEGAQDNDDTYEMPWGTWKDDQMPQGQKW